MDSEATSHPVLILYAASLKGHKQPKKEFRYEIRKRQEENLGLEITKWLFINAFLTSKAYNKLENDFKSLNYDVTIVILQMCMMLLTCSIANLLILFVYTMSYIRHSISSTTFRIWSIKRIELIWGVAVITSFMCVCKILKKTWLDWPNWRICCRVICQ